MKVIKELLLNPIGSVKKAKVGDAIGRISSILILEWLFIGLANIISFGNLGKLTMISAGISVFLIGIPITLFLGFLLFIIMKTLTGKGNYYRGLASVVFGLFPLSVALLVSSPFVYVIGIGFLFTLFILSIGGVMTISFLYRSVKEFFETDFITSWIGIGIVAAGLTLGVYLTTILLLGGTPDFAPVMSALGKLNI